MKLHIASCARLPAESEKVGKLYYIGEIGSVSQVMPNQGLGSEQLNGETIGFRLLHDMPRRCR